MRHRPPVTIRHHSLVTIHWSPFSPIHNSSIMKHIIKSTLIVLLLALCTTACKKKVDDFEFSGKAVGGGYYCAQDGLFDEFSYPIVLTEPEGVGTDFTFNGVTYHNVVRLFNTDYFLKDGMTVKGRMYLDDEYDQSYCTLHALDPEIKKLPQAVCTYLDL